MTPYFPGRYKNYSDKILNREQAGIVFCDDIMIASVVELTVLILTCKYGDLCPVDRNLTLAKCICKSMKVSLSSNL